MKNKIAFETVSMFFKTTQLKKNTDISKYVCDFGMRKMHPPEFRVIFSI